METPKVESKNYLELTQRNILQGHIILAMLGDTISNTELIGEWGKTYGKLVSEIVDHGDDEGSEVKIYESIRTLAREGNYKEAAKLVMELLPASDIWQKPQVEPEAPELKEAA